MEKKGGSGQEEGNAVPRAPFPLKCGCHFHFVTLKLHSPEKGDLFYLESKFSM